MSIFWTTAGDDWIKERQIEMKLEYGVDVNLERVMTLNRGESAFSCATHMVRFKGKAWRKTRGRPVP